MNWCTNTDDNPTFGRRQCREPLNRSGSGRCWRSRVAEPVSLDVSCCPDGDSKFIDVNGLTQIVFAVTDCMTGCDVILPSTI